MAIAGGGFPAEARLFFSSMVLRRRENGHKPCLCITASMYSANARRIALFPATSFPSGGRMETERGNLRTIYIKV